VLLYTGRNQDSDSEDDILHDDFETPVPKFTDDDENKLTEKLTTGGRVGLMNLGNTCFMAAALQCLSNTIPLTEYFLRKHFIADLNKDNPLGSSGQLLKQYAKLIRRLWGGQTANCYAPATFKRELANFAPHFAGTQQHDAHEFISFLLDGLHEDLNRVKKKPAVPCAEANGRSAEEQATEAWLGYLQRDCSVIVDLFQGQIKSELTCKKCGELSVKFDPIMYLSLPLDKGEEQQRTARGGVKTVMASYKTLYDSLAAFTKAETLGGDECWRCPKCKDFRPANKQLSLYKLPQILVIQLKRFRFHQQTGTRTKITAGISYPIEGLDLSPFVGKQKHPPIYNLYAVANHHGTCQDGHYTSSVMDGYGQWHLFDDEQVIDIKESRVANSISTAYVLFYMRADLPTAISRCVSRANSFRSQSDGGGGEGGGRRGRNMTPASPRRGNYRTGGGRRHAIALASEAEADCAAACKAVLSLTLPTDSRDSSAGEQGANATATRDSTDCVNTASERTRVQQQEEPPQLVSPKHVNNLRLNRVARQSISNPVHWPHRDSVVASEAIQTILRKIQQDKE